MKTRISMLAFFFLSVFAGGCSDPNGGVATADELRGIEESRLRALVDGDVGKARRLHSDDFELITPFGMAIGKDDYLGAIATGEVDYHVWQPGPMEVRLFPGVAVLRYQADVEITFRGTRLPRQHLWHTDLYELHGIRWQVVWSQATEVRGD